MNEIELLLHNGLQMLGMYIPKVIGAIIALIIGFKVVGWLSKYLERAMDKKDFDVSIKRFLSSLFSILLKVLLFVSVISMLGVKTTSFVAILGAAGLAIATSFKGCVKTRHSEGAERLKNPESRIKTGFFTSFRMTRNTVLMLFTQPLKLVATDRSNQSTFE
jgi:hypothetical protein